MTKQIELSKNQEDSDSLKMKAIIQKYEKMLEEQQDVWAKYEVCEITFVTLFRTNLQHFILHIFRFLICDPTPSDFGGANHNL